MVLVLFLACVGPRVRMMSVLLNTKVQLLLHIIVFCSMRKPSLIRLQHLALVGPRQQTLPIIEMNGIPKPADIETEERL